MTDQQQDQTSPTFNEAPASWNVKYSIKGYECMLTLRANTGAELMPKTLKVIEWLIEQSAAAGKQPGNGAAPAPASAPHPAPAAAQPQTEPEYEVIQVSTIAHVVSEKGHHSLKVKGGKYSKFGVTAWGEVIPAEGWEGWTIGQEYAPLDGMQFAVVRDGKKVTAFRKEAQA